MHLNIQHFVQPWQSCNIYIYIYALPIYIYTHILDKPFKCWFWICIWNTNHISTFSMVMLMISLYLKIIFLKCHFSEGSVNFYIWWIILIFFINSSSSKCNFSSFIAIHLFPFLSHVDHLWKLGEPSIPRQTGLQRPFSVAFLGCFYPASLVIGLIAPTDGRNWGSEIDLYSTKAQEALHLPVHFAGNTIKPYTDGLVQERRNSSALAMELRLSCTDPSISCGFLRHSFPPFKINCQMMCVLKFCFLQTKSAPDVLGHFVISHWPFYINGIILSVTIVWNYL